MRKIKKTDHKVVISVNNQNQLLETFISMKFDVECNETTPAISFHRFRGNIQNDANVRDKTANGTAQIVELEKKQGQIWNP